MIDFYYSRIYSKRFYTSDESKYIEDENGFVDMEGYDYTARSGYVNFDYGFYEEESGTWWNANHSEPGMKVYQSTLEHYSRPLLDFNRQIFIVKISTLIPIVKPSPESIHVGGDKHFLLTD